jgi:hypothetical protein
MKVNTKTIGVTLNEKEYNFLIDYKKRTGIGISTVLRSMVMKWVEEESKRND